MTTQAANPNTCGATCSPYEVLGWAWAEACSRLDKGEDPRKIEMPAVMAAFERDFPEVANAPRQPEPASGDRLNADVGTGKGVFPVGRQASQQGGDQ